MDNTISRNKSNAIKVIATLFMVIYHTFAFKDRINNVSYISIYNLTNTVTIEHFFSKFGGVCVQIFLFLSGYGLYQKYNSKVKYSDVIERVKKLLINYWIILFIFFSIGVILGKYPLNIKEFVSNFFTLSSSYNGEWWFLNIYIILILMYPIILVILNKFNIYQGLGLSIILKILGGGLIKFRVLSHISSGIITLIIGRLSIILTQQFIFVVGVLVAKYALFNKIKNKIELNKIIYLIVALAIVLIDVTGINIPVIDEFIKLGLRIIFIYILANLTPEISWLNKFSKHTTNVWLVHSFFCYYLFQNIAFAPRFSILIILWILFLSLIISTVINYILKLIYSIDAKY